MSVEDFLKKLQNRPQEVKAQRDLEAAHLGQSQIEAASKIAQARLEIQMQQDEERRWKITAIQQMWEASPHVRQRFEAIAGIIANGRVVTTIIGPKGQEGNLVGAQYDSDFPSISYSVPYRTVAGRPLIETNWRTEHTSGNMNAGMSSSMGGAPYSVCDYVPGGMQTLFDSLDIHISAPHDKPTLEHPEARFGISFYDARWEKYAPSIFGESKFKDGNPKAGQIYYFQNKFVTSGTFYFPEMPLQSGLNLNETLDESFTRLYDAYLQVTGQI